MEAEGVFAEKLSGWFVICRWFDLICRAKTTVAGWTIRVVMVMTSRMLIALRNVFSGFVCIL